MSARYEAVLTSSELSALCAAMGVPPPAGLGAAASRPPRRAPEAASPELRAALVVLADPPCRATVYRRTAALGLDMVVIAAGPDAAIVHGPLPGGLHRLACIRPDEVMGAVASLSRLVERPAVDVGEMQPCAADLEGAVAKVTGGDLGDGAL